MEWPLSSCLGPSIHWLDMLWACTPCSPSSTSTHEGTARCSSRGSGRSLQGRTAHRRTTAPCSWRAPSSTRWWLRAGPRCPSSSAPALACSTPRTPPAQSRRAPATSTSPPSWRGRRNSSSGRFCASTRRSSASRTGRSWLRAREAGPRRRGGAACPTRPRSLPPTSPEAQAGPRPRTPERGTACGRARRRPPRGRPRGRLRRRALRRTAPRRRRPLSQRQRTGRRAPQTGPQAPAPRTRVVWTRCGRTFRGLGNSASGAPASAWS
mmetsp:Transcript_94946/g.292715  ORF Transcript_94946/g.292715 Transcript_94946/m.292715 type:complete len:266 (-) Transcript_94946:381-1178(-)